MLKIWGRVNSINVQKVLWTVAEIELESERVDAGLQFGVVSEFWFGSYNPNRRIPTIEDDGLVLWESNVIVRYLTTKYSSGNLMPVKPEQRATAEMWMDWQQTTIMPSLGPLFLGQVRTRPEDRDQNALKSLAKEVLASLQVLDAQLAGRNFMLGDQFTVADIPLGCVAYRWYALDVEHGDLSNVRAWYDRLSKRSAFRKHVMLPLT